MNDKKIDQAPREGIKVRELRFPTSARNGGLEIPIPGPHGGRTSQVNSITAGKMSSGESFEITYQPWMRHHRVVYKRDDKATPKVFYIPEAVALFEALD